MDILANQVFKYVDTQVLLKFGTDRERSVYQRLEQQSAAVGAGQGYHGPGPPGAVKRPQRFS